MASLALCATEDKGHDSEELFTTLYSELHRLARRQLAQHVAIGVSATTLLHETYIDIAKRSSPEFPNSSSFVGYAARAMRGLIIDHLRNQRAQKRGTMFKIVSLDLDPAEHPVDQRELRLISDALDELEKIDAPLAEVVDLKFFCGFSLAEIAAMQGVSERTVQRNWEKARIYLHWCIRPDLSSGSVQTPRSCPRNEAGLCA
jgi:RNA polymerase sigma factor (TIGR02999 family)